jgi:chaperone modulatory protein CbpM
MMETSEFIVQSRLGEQVLEAWVKAGWLLPRQDGSKRDFSDVDLARAQLIRDLESLGVNDEGIPVILDLVDQMHGLRRTLRDLLSAIRAQPEAMQIVADLRTAVLRRPADDSAAFGRRPRLIACPCRKQTVAVRVGGYRAFRPGIMDFPSAKPTSHEPGPCPIPAYPWDLKPPGPDLLKSNPMRPPEPSSCAGGVKPYSRKIRR